MNDDLRKYEVRSPRHGDLIAQAEIANRVMDTLGRISGLPERTLTVRGTGGRMIECGGLYFDFVSPDSNQVGAIHYPGEDRRVFLVTSSEDYENVRAALLAATSES